MKAITKKRGLAVAMALALVMTAFAPAAYAGETGSLQASSGKAATLSAQVSKSKAKKKTIWVVDTYSSYAASGKVVGTTRYKYNAKGWVTSYTDSPAPGYAGQSGTRKYNKAGLMTSWVYSYGSDEATFKRTFKYSKAGRLTQMTEKVAKADKWGSYDSDFRIVTTYSYNKAGKATKIVENYYNWKSGDKTYSHVRDQYKLAYNKKGYIKKVTVGAKRYRNGSGWKDLGWWSGWVSYTYDSKGNLAKYTNSRGESESFTSTYKSGRLAMWHSGPGYDYGYTYKKVSVPVQYVKLVKQQQRELLGHNPSVSSPVRMF